MRTAVWSAPETITMEDRAIPEPGSGEALIRILAAGICGSELEGFLGHNSLRKPPLVMGHELCGEVVRCGPGSDSERFEPGTRVVVNPLLFCGECRSCRKGLTQLCAKRAIVGVHRPGGFAEYAVVPRSALVPVSAQLDPFRASLAEPLACSLRAASRALARHRFPNAVVFGAGGIGLLCAMTARIVGAAELLIVDTNPDRLAIAAKLGFAYTTGPAELETRLAEAFGERGADVVIDAAGFQATRESAMRILNPGGTLMNIGLGIDDTRLPINHLTRSEIEILGSFCYTREDFAAAVMLLEQGRITEQGWTEVRPLEAAEQAFKELVAGRVSNGKIFLQPREVL